MPIKNKMSMGYFLFIAGLLLLLKPLSAFKIIPLRYETIKKISCVAWSSDSRYLAASSDDHTFTVWDTETGVLLSWFKHRKESEKYLIDDTVALMFLEQGFFLAVYSCSNLLTVYSIRTGRIAFEQEGVPWPAFLGAQHPIKNIRLQISEHKNLSYDLFIKDNDLNEKNILLSSRIPISAVSWNHKGTHIALSTENSYLALYEYPSKKLIFAKKEHSLPIGGISWSPNSKKIVSYGDLYGIYMPTKKRYQKNPVLSPFF